MAYFKNQIKDNEIQVLLYLLEMILDDFFGKEYAYVTNENFKAFISKADTVSCKIAPISITVLKSIFELLEKDTGYRPKYTSIEFLIYGLFQNNISFERFKKDNKEDIDVYFKSRNYALLQKNSLNSLENKNYQLNQTPIQVNEVEDYIKNFFTTITKVVGDLSEREIDNKMKSVLPSLENKRITNRLQIRETRRQKNIESIILKASELIPSKTSFYDQIDEDWIFDFFEMGQDTSNEQMQYIWAKILANEIDKPDSFSRRAINAIKLLSPKEARIFTLFCNCLWEIHPNDTRSEKILLKHFDTLGGFSEDLLNTLKDLGLVHDGVVLLEKGELYDIHFFDKKHQLFSKEQSFELKIIRLSIIGSEIYNVVLAEKNEEYYQFILQYLNKNLLLKE